MSGVIVAVFLFSPEVEGLKNLTRIFYFHVPCAWVSVLAFLWSMAQSILYLKNGKFNNDAAAEASSRIGLFFCVLATGTGMVFAKATWGAYWNWDPRETSIFILLLVYFAYFALRMSVEDPERRARYAAVYSILAFFTVPFLVFILPRLLFSLHPSPIISKGGDMMMDPKIKIIFFSSLAGFTGLYVWLQNISTRITVLSNRKEEI